MEAGAEETEANEAKDEAASAILPAVLVKLLRPKLCWLWLLLLLLLPLLRAKESTADTAKAELAGGRARRDGDELDAGKAAPRLESAAAEGGYTDDDDDDDGTSGAAKSPGAAEELAGTSMGWEARAAGDCAAPCLDGLEAEAALEKDVAKEEVAAAEAGGATAEPSVERYATGTAWELAADAASERGAAAAKAAGPPATTYGAAGAEEVEEGCAAAAEDSATAAVVAATAEEEEEVSLFV